MAIKKSPVCRYRKRNNVKYKKRKRCTVRRLVGGTVKVGCIATCTLFTVYMLNLDQKLLAWTYARVNEIFDRKQADIKF